MSDKGQAQDKPSGGVAHHAFDDTTPGIGCDSDCRASHPCSICGLTRKKHRAAARPSDELERLRERVRALEADYQRQEKRDRLAHEALVRISGMPCISDLAGPEHDEPCACASCDAKVTMIRRAALAGEDQ